ncbi:ribonuclease H-like domain-containing protein [Rhizophagus diaphanus]|nr:ribonuclease H-like domain-containing protein [Rhizophagus diaphanus] [Rhizophagus sp. MUCL 43196]
MGIKLFFDVVVPEEIPLSTFKTRLVNILSNTLKGTSKFGIENISAFPLQGYHTEKKLYIRIITWNQFDQYNTLKAVREVSIRTASDDLIPIYYYRKVAREKRLPLSSWATLSNYFHEYIQGDRTLVLTWDIETYSLLGLDVETASDPSWITIICGSQTNLLKAFALCQKLLSLNIQIGFNNSQYDWQFIVEKAKKLGVLKRMFNRMSLKLLSLEKITKWQYQYNKIKINDMPFHSKHLNTLGCVAIDVRPCFMKFYSKAEKSSLAFYLNECGLESKIDMPFYRIFKYYERALRETNTITAKQMHEVAKYCMIDTLSCQRLMVKRNVINEYREVANIAFISLSDAHYFAIGIKVSNLLSASAWREGVLTSTISERTETESFPGVYIFPPIKGLENRHPVTGLDFRSLYPSLIMTYNLSPNKIILSQKYAEFLRNSGKTLHEINFKFNGIDVLA